MLNLKARKIKQLIIKAKEAGIIIKSFKNGCFVAQDGLEYTKNELLIMAYGNDAAPEWLKRIKE